MTPKFDYPLIAPKSIYEFTPPTFYTYVVGLYRDPIVDKPLPKSVTLTYNKKGIPILTIRRKPKWITREEIDALAEEHNRPKAELFLLVKKRKIPISTQTEQEAIQKSLKELPW